MEFLVVGDKTTVFAKGSSLALRIPIFLFRQVFRNSRLNIFIDGDFIFIGDSKFFPEDRGGEFRNITQDSKTSPNKITLTQMLKNLDISEFDELETYTDFQTYIKIKKCDIIK